MEGSDRWKQVKEILYSALELPAAERSSFLDKSCGDDIELRRELDSLIGAHDRAAARFESPAVEVMAAVVSDDAADGQVRRSLGHYRITDKLGAGGMGEVYLALDTRLNRKVALKILPSFFTQDPDRLRRFQQEARAASALNHPNILTIHEVGQLDSTHYIATEFVDGGSLRDHITNGPLKISEALGIATQVARALGAAHDAGIIHRDVKPENIMLRRDGIVKVVDFGLAKLGAPPEGDAEASTIVNTGEGIVMGTAQYMSPEQARGSSLDVRTDIWSLGVVLYEMLAGRSPFAESTPGDVVVSILEREPPPLARYARGVPRELQRIITKNLAKDREKRYQSAKDLLIDLKNLRDELEFEAKLEYSAQPMASGETTTVRQPVVEDTQQPGQRTTGSITQQPTSSAEYIVQQIKLHPFILIVAVGVVTLTLAGFGIIYKSYWTTPDQHVSPMAMKITRLTGTGKASRAVISPDGKYVVHVASQEGQQHLRVRQVNTNSDVQKVPPAEVRYTGLTFSPDGDFIFYVVSEANSRQNTLYQVPVVGGTPRKLISNVDSAVTFAPDGKRLAFVRHLFEQGEHAVIVANVDGSNERNLAVRKFPNFFTSVAWSADGTTLACGAGSHVPVYNTHLVELPVDGGPEKPIGSHAWSYMGQVGWLRDGSGLIVDASEEASANFDFSQIWYLSRSGDEVRRITNDLNNYSGVSLTSDSSRLVTVQSETVSNVWLIPNGSDASRATPVAGEGSKRDGKDGLAWTPGGKIVYVSKASGNDDIWVMNADGSGQTQLTSNAGINLHPAVSPDGRYIVFTSSRDGAIHIWRMDIDGSNPKQLTSGSGEDHAQFSPDGNWVIYTLHAGKPNLWRVSVEGGAPLPISEKSLSSPAVSPDGKMIAAVHWDEQPNSPARIAVIPFEGAETATFFDPPRSTWSNIRWMPDGNALGYVITSGGVSNIWVQPLSGGAPRQLTDFKNDQIFWFNWSRDGKQIVCARGMETSDVVLISNFSGIN